MSSSGPRASRAVWRAMSSAARPGANALLRPLYASSRLATRSVARAVHEEEQNGRYRCLRISTQQMAMKNLT